MAKRNEVVAITSPTHAMALVVYFCTAVQGVFFLTGVSSARGVEDIIGRDSLLFAVWAYGFVVFGALSFISSLTSKYFRKPNSILKVELAAIVGLIPGYLLYQVSLQQQGFASDNYVKPGLEMLKGFTFAATTQLFAVGAIIGGIARIIQITLDLWKLRRRLINKFRDDVIHEA